MAKSLKETLLKELKKSKSGVQKEKVAKQFEVNLELFADRTVIQYPLVKFEDIKPINSYDGVLDLEKIYYFKLDSGFKKTSAVIALPLKSDEDGYAISFFQCACVKKKVWVYHGCMLSSPSGWFHTAASVETAPISDQVCKFLLHALLGQLMKTKPARNVVKFEAYTGPYKFIKGTLNCDQISDAKLIKYTFENTAKPFEQIMVEEIPFSNFLLELNVADGSTTRPTYLHYLNGFLRVLAVAKEEGMFVNMADINLNNWKVGVSLTINPTDVNIYPDLFKSDDEWIKKFTASLNYWIGGFTEFMYKFNRLMPYIEQPASVQKEIHVAQVVNNISVYKIVQLGDVRKTSTQGRNGGAHASPREHTRIGHKRVYKRTGKEIWLNEITVNEGVKAKIHKEYKM